jgi:hypothetical protein
MNRSSIETGVILLLILSLAMLAMPRGWEVEPSGFRRVSASTLANARGGIPVPCSRCSNVKNTSCPATPVAPTCWTSYYYASEDDPTSLTYKCNPTSAAWGCTVVGAYHTCHWGTSWCAHGGPGQCGSAETIECNTQAPNAGGGKVCAGGTTTTIYDPPCENDCS